MVGGSMHGSARATNVRIRRRPRMWLPVAAVFGVIGLFALANLWLIAMLLVLAGSFIFLMLPAIVYDDAPAGHRTVPLVNADRSGVTFGKRLVLRRDRIEAAGIEVLRDGGRVVQLWGKRASDDLDIFLEDDKRAQLFLDALGLGPERHAARYLVASGPLRSRRRARAVAAARLGGAVAIGGTVVWAMGREPLAGFALVPALFVYYTLIHSFRRHRRITLGTDALVVGEPVALAAIGKVESVGDSDARVAHVGGAWTLRFDGRGAREKRDAFVARLQQSLARAARSSNLTSLLGPAGRSTEAWLSEIRRLAGEGYRGGGAPAEELWRVVENAATEPGARVGALAALVSRLDAEGRERVEALREGTVRGDVRAAFAVAAAEGATDGDVLGAYARAGAR